ncbi:receptor-type tyrosine-protein phosphatase alpha-like isoform X2 [Haliotis asinina]|uniref:receptor-type tyrosine-protein phosphatase alpha-like isoform X2 n=1 Tax=Haliotis asinina TaxID=109174 RepID=UPI003531ED53
MAWLLIGLLFFSICGTLTDAECHCNTAAACTVFPSTPCSQVGDPDRCQEGWFGSYCQKQNIALGRSATQSSTFTENSYRTGNTLHSFDARYGVDGRATTNFYSKPLTCTHTLLGGVQTWTVSLNNSITDKIQQIMLYLRQDFTERNRGMNIFVGGQPCLQWSTDTSPPSVADVKCQQALTGNTLTIQTSSYLTLCEVQIFVCSDGWFGEDCDKQCHCARNTEVCDKISGQCLSGCAVGYTGINCQTACPDGYYGDCTSTCGKCFNSAHCNKATGICPNGCAAGWQRDTCLQPCPDGYYGDCMTKCGNCLDAAYCNKASGTCPGGCEPGWRTDRCLQPCPDGYYGLACGFQCGNCVDGDVCIKTNGTCPRGCAAGWISDMCKQACPDGYYGTDCTSKCGHCLDKDVCDKSTGACPRGCAAGWINNTCHNMCEDGKYGSGCMSECGRCRSGTVCDKTNGTCGTGCDGGYSGARCERLSVNGGKEGSMGGIIGGTVAALLAIAIVIIIVVVIIFRRRKQPKHDDERLKSTQDMTNLKNGTDKAVRKKPSSTPATKDNEDEDAILSVEAEVDVDNDAAAIYYNFVPPHMTLDTLQQCITGKKEKATFQTEFQAIPYGAKHPHDIGKKPENKMKNRFLALYPYDESRVVLADGEDYINANYISGYGDTQKYIATQGPKPGTVPDFWRMVWQEDVTQIVMLTRLMEMNKKKSAKYWPDPTKTESYGNIQVKNKDATARADYTISTFLVRCSDVERTVTHYHFTSWPDHGVPSAPALVNFWKLVKQGDMDRGPMVVHCSAGVGRTGAFIALDYLMDEAESNHINVFMCVSKMRENRMNMVQTVSQYEFVHDVVLEALHSRGTFYTLPEFDKTFGFEESATTQQQLILKKQFKLLRELSSNLSKETVSHALLPENSDKNRSLDILPGNDSRPYLCTPVQKRNDYINGVFLPSTLHLSSLIVTQTPIPDTVVDFWRLVYDHDCFTIVCLDDAQETTGMYPEEYKELKQGPFSVVQVEADSNREFYTEKKMKLTYDKENSEKSVSLFSLQSLDMLTNTGILLELVSRVDRIISSVDHKVLVHCHDGAGASGVFCSVLNIITRLKLDRTVDIFLTTRELQRVRPQFIQALDQFKLCYDMVKEYNRASNVYANL